jgi:hypothetical protein
MQLEAFAQAKPCGPLHRWGPILGTGWGTLEQGAYALEATKKAICWPFKSPLTDSNRRPPPYHALQSATGRNPRQRFPLVSAGSRGSDLRPVATGCSHRAP